MGTTMEFITYYIIIICCHTTDTPGNQPLTAKYSVTASLRPISVDLFLDSNKIFPLSDRRCSYKKKKITVIQPTIQNL